MSTTRRGDWGLFNDHLAGMSDQELGQRLNKVKNTPWASHWRWKGFGDSMQNEFDKRPWINWNDHPEERTGMGTSYINSQMESGQSLADIKQEAFDKNWVIGPDAWDKFYSTDQDTGYQKDSRGVWSRGTSSSPNSLATLEAKDSGDRGLEAFANSQRMSSGNNPTGGAANSLKISTKPKRKNTIEPVFTNTITL